MMQCDLCGGGHGNQEYQAIKSLTMPNKHVDYIGSAPRLQNNTYSNTYNLGQKNHPNFSQGNQGQNRQNYPPRFKYQHLAWEKKSSLEDLMVKLI